jgi:ABC-type Mn2+/Zn2+ transport system permease subunit
MDVQKIVLGNVLAITPGDRMQLFIIGGVTLTVLALKWKDLMAVFFDESHARSIGLNANLLRIVFFTLLSASTVAAMQTVGAFLVIAAGGDTRRHRLPAHRPLPAADRDCRRHRLDHLALLGAYLSYFLDGATGGVVIMLQTGIFLLAFVFAPRHGILAQRAQGRAARPPRRSGLMDALMDFFIDPFRFAYMQKAFLITFLIALPMAAMSSLMVLKGWSLMGDAMSHAVLPGIVMAYVAGLPLVIGAFAAGLFCAVATGWLNANSRVKEDTVMGIVFSGMFGLGIVLHVSVRSSLHLDHILFGDMLGVAWSDIGERPPSSLHCAAGSC